MHTLSQLLSAIIVQQVHTGPGTDPDRLPVTALTDDSRAVTPGAMYVALEGTNVDGHRFIPQAIAAGAVAVVCRRLPTELPESVAFVQVADTAVALGFLASEWYGNPSRHLTLVGVTGTNGKTTVATLLSEAMTLLGVKSGLLSTVENRIGSQRIPATHTTGSQLEINRLLAQMVADGCGFAAMEVSSHGAQQQRIAGLHFAGAIFTNLTRDHLDYHNTVAAYIAAKKKFFDQLPRSAWALVNADDPNGAVMLQNTLAHRHTYGLKRAADYHCRITEMHLGNTEMQIDSTALTTQFTGRFNAMNLTAVFGALRLMGVSAHQAAVTVSSLRPVCGRFETLHHGPVTAIIDYAHTPDALENVLDSIRAVEPSAHIITVTGAGGNRDKGKRPLMGAVAARHSDTLIITSDNPRDEDPATIADEIAAGAPEHPHTIILDRAQAIAHAVQQGAEKAAKGARAVVLVAGKGHETYQEFENHRRIHFDDHEHVLTAFNTPLEPVRQ